MGVMMTNNDEKWRMSLRFEHLTEPCSGWRVRPAKFPENDPNASGGHQALDPKAKLVKWHGGSGYVKKRHATPKKFRRGVTLTDIR